MYKRQGLSQLYQIKGRVGRSDRLAYAYLMYSPQKQLSEIAMKRLKSIKEDVYKRQAYRCTIYRYDYFHQGISENTGKGT